jgi:hypothetical protein
MRARTLFMGWPVLSRRNLQLCNRKTGHGTLGEPRQCADRRRLHDFSDRAEQRQTWRYRKQVTKWSFTIPTACINA